MNIKKWLISAVFLTFALGTAGAVTAFALTADGGGDNPEVRDGTDTAGEVLHGDPTYEEWLSDFGNETVVTSIDDIDPNVCNWIHNINACTPEELKELGGAPIAGSIAVGEPHPVSGPDLGMEVEGKPEPLIEDAELGYIETTKHECALDQGVSVTSDGQVSCVDVIVLNDGEQDPSQEQSSPAVIPQVAPSAG